MKNFNFRLLIIFILSSFLFSANYELNSFYKDERNLAMGGIGVVTGGKATSTLLNPAGLVYMDQSGEIDFSLLQLNIGTGDALIKKYLNNEINTSDTAGMISAVLGENVNLDLNLYQYLAAKIGMVTASLGVITTSNTNLKVHSGFGPAGLIELDTTAYFGPVLSTSFSVENALHLGVGLKTIGSYAKAKNIGLGDALDPEFSTKLKQDLGIDDLPSSLLKKLNYDTVLDFGAIYDLDNLRRVSGSRLLNRALDILNPSLGVSILNIGGYLTESDMAYIPQTINAGFAIRPYCAWFRELVISAELQDILSGYDINQSRGYMGKIRTGFEGYIIKNILMDVALRGGWLNNDWSAGINARIAFLHIGVTSYVEEMGGYISQAPDRRYLVNLGLKF